PLDVVLGVVANLRDRGLDRRVLEPLGVLRDERLEQRRLAQRVDLRRRAADLARYLDRGVLPGRQKHRDQLLDRALRRRDRRRAHARPRTNGPVLRYAARPVATCARPLANPPGIPSAWPTATRVASKLRAMTHRPKSRLFGAGVWETLRW